MNIVRSFLLTALAVEPSDLLFVANERLSDNPLTKDLGYGFSDLLQAEPEILNELWKYSLALDVPHQLLCDCYWLQQKTTQQYSHP